jgi:hypothetical protein
MAVKEAAMLLRDIHLPPEVGGVAPGWIVVWFFSAILCFLIAVFCLRKVSVALKRQRILEEYKEIRVQLRGDPGKGLLALSQFMRQLALLRYPRKRFAKCTGEAWLLFLDETGETDKFTKGPGEILAYGVYEKECVLDEAALNVIDEWIKKHV